MILYFILMPAECRKEVIVKFHFVCIALINQEKTVHEIRRNSDWRENVDAIAAILEKMKTKDFRLVAVDEDDI